ncbi:MAG: aldose 1-epimerase family protein [Thermoleophilaceae bacterium]
MSSPSGEQIELRLDDQSAVVTEVGAGLRAYSSGGRALLDGYGADEMSPSGRGQVLMPWPNRIEDGVYEFEGHSHQLPLNQTGESNAIHGLVRWVAWTVAEREPHRAVLRYVLPPQPGYPFSLALVIEYLLTEEGLRVQTTAENVGSETCPYGAGAHPYLAVGTPTVDPVLLRAPAATMLRSDERGIPIGSASVEGTEFDFRRGRPIGDTKLDHCFTDLERDDDGLARVELRDPDGGSVALWVDEGYRYLMLFTGDPLPDVARRSLAVEPMTCPPNAFRTGEALVRLDPGRSSTGGWGITYG